MFEILSIFVPVAHASVDTFIRKVNTFIINPLIIFFFVLAIVVFVLGIVQYLRHADKPDERETGRSHMMWGAIGLAIMIGVFFIMRVILGTIGIDEYEINPETGEVNISNP